MGQTTGKIWSKDEAEQLYGEVLQSASMNCKELKNIISGTDENVMFRLLDGNVAILGDGRKVIYPAGASVSAEDVFSRFSKSVVEELLTKSEEETLYVENRKEVLTVTYGESTLELGLPCPPWCAE